LSSTAKWRWRQPSLVRSTTPRPGPRRANRKKLWIEPCRVSFHVLSTHQAELTLSGGFLLLYQNSFNFLRHLLNTSPIRSSLPAGRQVSLSTRRSKFIKEPNFGSFMV
jgi:hypothetical protein